MKPIENGHGKKHYLLFLILGRNLLMIDPLKKSSKIMSNSLDLINGS